MKKVLRAMLAAMMLLTLAGTAMAADLENAASDDATNGGIVEAIEPQEFPEPEFGPCSLCRKHFAEEAETIFEEPRPTETRDTHVVCGDTCREHMNSTASEVVEPTPEVVELAPYQHKDCSACREYMNRYTDGSSEWSSAIDAELPPTASAEESVIYLGEPPLMTEPIPVVSEEEPDYGYDEPGPGMRITVHYAEDESKRIVDDDFLAENPVLAQALEECGGCIEAIYISRDRYEAYFVECGGGMGFHICNWDMDMSNPDDFRLMRVPTRARYFGVMGDRVYLAVYAEESIVSEFDFNGSHYEIWEFADEVQEALDYQDLRLDERANFSPVLVEATPLEYEPEVVPPEEVLPIW